VEKGLDADVGDNDKTLKKETDNNKIEGLI